MIYSAIMTENSAETPDYTVRTEDINLAYAEVDRVHEQLMGLSQLNDELKEDLNRAKAQFDMLKAEDQGWSLLFGSTYDRDEKTGIKLDTLKDVSEKLREEVAGSSLPKKANEARYSYTFSKGFIIPGVDKDAPKPKRGPGRPRKADNAQTEIRAFLTSPTVHQHVWSEEGQVAMHTASSTDGVFLLLGDDQTKEVHPIPLHDITAVVTNPDHADDIWAYRRTWTRFETDPKGEVKSKEMSRWYYTDRYRGVRKASIGKVQVDRGKTMLEVSFNRQTGWTYGIPDLMAGQIWYKKYLTMIAYGESVTAALAHYTAKVKVGSQAGANKVGVTVAKPGSRPGGTHAYGEGNDISVFQSAGKTYDFGGLRIFAAMYAAAVGVPLTDLSADPSSAGASYGSAAALMPGARRAIEARREQWADFIGRLIKWGTGHEIEVTPESILEEDAYRMAQKIGIAWGTGLFHEDEIRPALAKIAGVTLFHGKAPENVLLPNNSDSWERADIDPKDDPKGGSMSAPPDQGKSNGTGGSGDAAKKDTRSDTVASKTAEQFSALADNSELRSEIEELKTLVTTILERMV